MTGIMCDMKQNAMAGSAVPVSLVQFLIVGHLCSLVDGPAPHFMKPGYNKP